MILEEILNQELMGSYPGMDYQMGKEIDELLCKHNLVWGEIGDPQVDYEKVIQIIIAYEKRLK